MVSDNGASAVASVREVPEEEPGPRQDCSDIVHLSLFFDGTGNNDEADGAEKKWSNVSRIFHAAQQFGDNDAPHYPIYVSGVGTKFNGKAADWLNAAGVWIEDGALGLGAGAGGSRRLGFGEENVNDRLRDILVANAKRLGGEVAAYANSSSDKSFAEVNEALSKHRLVKSINLSVFGFSRGAALARAFTNRLIRGCQEAGGELLYAGHPFKVRFMGLFDTVASFGLPAQNVQLPFLERDLVIPAAAERCVHYVAGHELRFSFPVDLIRKDGALKGDWLELVYPGVHSDVGGGYAPMDQGIDNNLARIPMRDMMREALRAGVKMRPYDEIRSDWAQFKERYECRPETESLYRDYLSVVGPGSGPVEEQVKRHMQVYYSAYGTMHRTGKEGPGDRQRAASTVKSLGPVSLAKRMQLYRDAAAAAKMVRYGGSNLDAYAQYLKPEQWQIDAWDADANERVVQFVSTCIHDSKVDFLKNAEPFHYFRMRVIQESTVSVWREASDWVSEQASAAKEGVERVVETGIGWIRQMFSEGRKSSGRGQDRVDDLF